MVGRIAKSPRHSKKSLKGSRRRTATIECLESRLMLSATQLLPTGDATEAVPPFVAFNGSVYFLTGDSLTDTMLWKTNGTLAGTTLVKNLGVKDSPGQLVASGSEMSLKSPIPTMRASFGSRTGRRRTPPPSPPGTIQTN